MALTEKQNAIIAISILFPLTAALLVGFRLRARVLTSEPIRADDYWVVTAAIISVASMIAYIFSAVVACAGVHAENCTPSQQIQFAKIVFAVQSLYLASISSVKMSLLLFYKRVFPRKRFGYVVTATIAMSGLWFVAFFLAQLLENWPISGNWEWTANGTYAWVINVVAMNTWLCGTDVFADIFLIILPVPMIVSLRMNMRQKLAFPGIFSLGLLTAIASGMRLLSAERFISVDSNADKTYLLADPVVWTCIEPCLGIVCACLPLLHPFFKRHSPEKIVGAHKSGYASVQTNKPALVHRSTKDFEDYSTRVAQFHESVID